MKSEFNMLDDKQFLIKCRNFANQVIAPNYIRYDRENSFPELIHQKAHELNLVNLLEQGKPIGDNTAILKELTIFKDLQYLIN